MSTTTASPATNETRKTGSNIIRTYVLDTCVLLHDPRAIFNFQENNILIPAAVLEELDKIKVEQDSERGRNARIVHRSLLELFPTAQSMIEGVALPNGGKLLMLVPGELDETVKKFPPRLRNVLRDLEKQDNRILLTAIYAKSTFPPPTVLVTKDANVALKARALGLESEDYRNDQVDAKDMGQSDGCETVAVAEHELQAFASLHRLDVMGREPALVPNQYVLLRTPGGHTMPARATGTGDVVVLRFPQTICPASTPVRPRNLEQQFLCDALFNPDIKIVTVRGQAGTGKTLITMAAALAQATGPNARYDRVTISRPVITVGKDIGFLPGSMIEKLSPFLQCYYDALEFLFNQKRTLQPQFVDKKQSGRKHRHGCAGLPEAPALRAQSSQGPSAKPYDGLLKAGILQIEGLCFIRGRSIPNTVMIVDECQNLTRTEIRTIVTRMSEGSKLILLGDESQIDQPFIDARSNGLVHTAVKFRGQMIAAQINLTRCERSELAELGANLL